MSNKETVLQDGDLVIEKITPESDDLQPITFKRLKQDIKEEEGDCQQTCWGCRQLFGNTNADPLTMRLFRIFEEGIMHVPDEQIFAEIMMAQQELFVNVNPEEHSLWTVDSIRNHVTNHMVYSRYNNIRDYRNFSEIEKAMSDTLFRKDEITGQIDVDPKKVDALLRVNKSKNDALRLCEGLES
jgi:hypothetical protein